MTLRKTTGIGLAAIVAALGMTFAFRGCGVQDGAELASIGTPPARPMPTKERARAPDDPPASAGIEPIQPEEPSSVVRYVDVEGKRVPSVTTAIASDEAPPVQLPPSDATSEFRIPVRMLETAARGAELVARAPGFAVNRTPLSKLTTPDQGPFEVRLVRAVQLAGTVRTSSGQPVPPGLRAVATPPDRIPYSGGDRGNFKYNVGADPRWLVGEVGADGTYTLDGLSPLTTYAIVVGAPGAVGRAQITTTDVGPDRCDVVVRGVYRLRASLRDPTGNPVRGPGGVDWMPGPSVAYPRDLNCKMLIDTDIYFGLLGRPADAPRSGRQGDGSVADLVFTCDSIDEVVGPIPFGIICPGWKPAAAQLWATRIGLTQQESTITLEPVASDFGDLTVDVSTERSTLHEDEILAWVKGLDVVIRRDDPLDDRVANLQFPVLRLPSTDAHLVRGLPVGNYRVWIRSQYPMVTESPAVAASVEPRNNTRIELKLTLEPVVRIQPIASAGVAYSGPLTLEVLWRAPASDTWNSATLQFRAPPYALPGLAPGSYRFKVSAPGKLRGEADALVAAENTPTVGVQLQ